MDSWEVANRIVNDAGPHEFVMLDFYHLMEQEGFTREAAALEFRRLVTEGCIVHVGKCGLAFTYRVRKAL